MATMELTLTLTLYRFALMTLTRRSRTNVATGSTGTQNTLKSQHRTGHTRGKGILGCYYRKRELDGDDEM